LFYISAFLANKPVLFVIFIGRFAKKINSDQGSDTYKNEPLTLGSAGDAPLEALVGLGMGIHPHPFTLPLHSHLS